MRFEEALFDYLSADGGVAGLVEDRIYPVRLPEGAKLPAISWFQVSSDRIPTYDPFPRDDWTRKRIQFNSWATDPNTAMLVGEAVMLALSGYDGDMSGLAIGSSESVTELDTYDGQTKLFRKIQDFHISYEEDLEPSS